MYNVIGLNKSNFKFIIDLNKKRGNFNSANEDLVEFYNNINFAEKIFLAKRVKLLKYEDTLQGYCWVSKLSKHTYHINSIYVDKASEPLLAYKTLIDSFEQNKKFLYLCEKNEYNYDMLRDLGFIKREGTLGMIAEIKGKSLKCASDNIFFIPLQKGKHEQMRCHIQNEVFKNDSRIPLTVDDMYYDELQSYYCEDGAVFIKYEDSFIGYGQVIIINGTPTIVNVGILDQYRGKGYGRLLMNYLMEFLLEEGYKEVKLKVAADNSSAIKLYENLGFKTFKENYQWEYTK